jgi:hypothetical protein
MPERDDDVRRAGALRDQPGRAIDGAIPDAARGIELRVTGAEDASPEPCDAAARRVAPRAPFPPIRERRVFFARPGTQLPVR